MAITVKLITPARFGDPYLYEVTHTGGMVRVGTSPRIEEDGTFSLHYVSSSSKLYQKPCTDLWDLNLLYANTKPREIDVQVCVDGGGKTEDRPTVQDGKM